MIFSAVAAASAFPVVSGWRRSYVETALCTAEVAVKMDMLPFTPSRILFVVGQIRFELMALNV